MYGTIAWPSVLLAVRVESPTVRAGRAIVRMELWAVNKPVGEKICSKMP